MSDMIEILERELESAVEVKDRSALHRCVTMLVESVVGRKEYEHSERSVSREIGELRGEVRLIAERMEQGFARMDERFAATDKRFEAMDKRFEAMDKRFEAMDKRFEDLTHHMDKRFESVDKRFESVDKRFEDMNKRFSMLVALNTTFFVVLATMMTVLRLFG